MGGWVLVIAASFNQLLSNASLGCVFSCVGIVGSWFRARPGVKAELCGLKGKYRSGPWAIQEVWEFAEPKVTDP